MQFKAVSAFVLLATLAAATPAKRGDKPASECSTAPVQCCDSTTKASDPSVVPILAAVGAVITDPSILVGTGCSPLSVVGVGSGATCDAHPVCCENNSFGSLISIGCVPVDLSL